MKQNVLVNTLVVLALICLVGFISVISFFLNKGFDLSDESYYLLCTKYPLDTKLLNTAFGLINHRLAFGCNDLYSLRLFKLIYQLVFLFVFGRAFFVFVVKRLNTNKNVGLLLSIIIIISGLSNYDYLPMTLSYNSWSLNFGLLFWSGLLFSQTSESKIISSLANLLMGFSVVFLFYTKAPNAIVIGMFFILYTLIFRRENIISSFLFFGFGKIIGAILLFMSFEDFKNTTNNLIQTIVTTKHTDVGGYIDQISEMISNGLGARFFILEGIILLIMFFLRKFNVNSIVGVLILVLNTYFTFNYYKGNSFDVSNEFKVFSVFAFNCFGALILFFSGSRDFKSNFIPLLLILTPFMLAAGTSNSIFYTSSQLIAFSISGLFLLLLLQSNRIEMELYYAYSFVFITFFIGSFLYYGMIHYPYRQESLSKKNSLLPQTTQIINIFENKERFFKYNELAYKLKTHNTTNLPVLSSPPALGVLFLTNMKPFAVCWIADPEEMTIANEEYFKKLELKHNKPFLVISQQIYYGKKQNLTFINGGMDLKLDYVIKDSVYLDLNKEYYYLMQPITNG